MSRRPAFAVILALLLSMTSGPAAAAPPQFAPGAAGLGDPYFPDDGNGGYDVEHYLLDVQYDPATDTLIGVATITARATQNLSSFNLDFDDPLTASTVSVNRSAATAVHLGDELVITPASGIRNNTRFVVVIAYDGVPQTLEDLFDKGELGEFFRYVDWSRTRAYAMGLGNIYINLMGREPQGSVVPGRDYEETRASIARKLEDLVDPETGERPVARVYRREEIYSGFDPRLIPDLRAANTAHYRIGWQTALGEVPPQVFEDNLKAWSGDHCSNDPALVPGVLFSNAPLAGSAPGIADIYPTVLALLGVPPVGGIDGRSLAH